MKRGSLAALLFATLTACPCEQEPFDVSRSRATVLEDWNEAVGPVSDKCRAMVDDADMVFLDADTMSETCGHPGRGVLGCMYAWDYSRAWLALDEDHGRTNHTLIHEYAHVLQWCELSVIDSKHKDERIWDVMF